MADLAKLVVRLEAQTSQYTAQLEKANARLASFETSAKKSLSAIDGAFKKLLTGAAVIALTRSLIGLSDTYTRIQNRLKLVTSSSQELAAVQTKLFQSAQKTSSGYEETVDLYSKLTRSSGQLGLSQKQLLDITELVNKSLALGSATTGEAASTVLQFGQAIASGKLAGDEFKAVLENAPRLAKALTDGLGVTIGKLYELRSQGKLTVDTVIKALLTQVPVLEKEFGSVSKTVSASFVNLKNSLIQTFGEIGSSVLGKTLSVSVQALANSVGELSKILLIGATAWAVYRGSIAVTEILASTKAFIELYGAVSSGRAILLGSAAADKAKAASVLVSTQAELDRATATLASIRAEQSRALVTTASTKVIDAQAVAMVTAAQADYAKAASATAIVRAEQAKAVALGITTKVIDKEAAANLIAAKSEHARAAAAVEAYRAQRAASTAALVGSAKAVVERKTGKLDAELVAAKTALAAAESRLAKATIVTNDAFYARAAAAKQLQILEEQELVAKTALAAAEARLAKATIVTNDAMYARAAAAKQIGALEAEVAAASAAVVAAQGKVNQTAKVGTGAFALLGASFKSILSPFKSLAGLAAANPIGAIVAGVAAAGVALYSFRDDIKASADGIVTLGDTARATFQILGETLAPVGNFIKKIFVSIYDAFKLIFDGIVFVAKKAAESVIAAFSSLPIIGTAFKKVGEFISGTLDKIQKRARKLAEERKKLAESAAGGGKPAVVTDDSKALESIKKMTESLQQQIVTEKEGALAALKFRIEQGDLKDEFDGLKVSGEKYKRVLYELTTVMESLKLDKMIDDLKQQVATQDKGAATTMRYRIAQGDLKKTFDELGVSADSQKKKLIALAQAQDDQRFKSLLKDMKQQQATFEQSGESVLRYRLQFGDLSEAYKDASAAGKRFANQAVEIQAAMDNIQIERQLKDINAQLLELQGNSAKAVEIKFDIDNAPLINALKSKDDTAGLTKLYEQKQEIVNQSAINDLNSKAGRIKDELQRREEQIQNTLKTGAISELESMKQTGEAREGTVKQLEEIAAKMQKIAELSQSEDLKNGVKQFAAEVENLKTQTDLVAESVKTTFKDEFSSAFVDIATGAKSAGNAVEDMIEGIGKRLLNLIAQNYAEKLFAQFLTAGGGAAGGGGGWLSTIGALFAGGRATGGGVEAGKMYKVNERTPNSEWFVPGMSGRVVPPGDGSSTVNNFTLNVKAEGGRISRQTEMQVLAASARGVAMASRRNN